MSMTISIDDDLKQEFTAVCKEIGMTPSAAFTVFAKTVVREKRIPFELSAESERDRALRAYEQSINAGLLESYRQFEAGDYCSAEEFDEKLKQLKDIA